MPGAGTGAGSGAGAGKGAPHASATTAARDGGRSRHSLPRSGALLCSLTLLVAAATIPAQTAYVRVTCRGVQELSLSGRASCDESSVLSDHDGRLVFGHTAAGASLVDGSLEASASGGSIRDVGYDGGEATALLRDEITVAGEWQGSVTLTVSMRIVYRFAGFGESRIHASLSATTTQVPLSSNAVQVRLTHRGFNQATLTKVIDDGTNHTPAEGTYPAQSAIDVSVTETLTLASPRLVVRARVDGYALPNLDAINPSAASLVDAEAQLSVSAPDDLDIKSASGLFLSEPR